MKRQNKLFFLGIALSLLMSCGSDRFEVGSAPGTTDAIDTTDTTALFIDSPVKGLEYSSASSSGVTTGTGFRCHSSETVTFKINDMEVGSATCSTWMNPQSITDSTHLSSTSAFNLAFLLQSMDADSDPENGIDITNAKSLITAPIDLTDNVAIDTLVSTMPFSGLTRNDARSHVEMRSGNSGSYSVSVSCEGAPSDSSYSGTCSTGWSAKASFDGLTFKLIKEGFSNSHNTEMSSGIEFSNSHYQLFFGGVLGAQNATTGAVSMSSGNALYFKDTEETSSSVCTGLGHTYIQHAIRITDVELQPSWPGGTGKYAYTVTCDNAGDKTDYDEFWGEITFIGEFTPIVHPPL